MQRILDMVQDGRREFESHPVWKLFTDENVNVVLRSLDSLAFWVPAFQDMIRINVANVTDEDLRLILTRHREEERGHDKMLWHDLRLFGQLPSVPDLWDTRFTVTRDASWKLVSEVIRASSDFTRVAIVFVHEATGEVFFTRTVPYFRNVEASKGLVFYGDTHLNIELSHEIWEHEVQATMRMVVLPSSIFNEAGSAVARSFRAYMGILDQFKSDIERHLREVTA